jgi:hypothetical protein
MSHDLAHLRNRVQVLAAQLAAVDAGDGEVFKLMLHELASYNSFDLVVLDGHPLDDLRSLDRARRQRLRCILSDEPGWRNAALRLTLVVAKELIREVELVGAATVTQSRPIERERHRRISC